MADTGSPLIVKLELTAADEVDVPLIVTLPVVLPVAGLLQLAAELNELAAAPAQMVISFTLLSGGVTLIVAVPVTVQPFTSLPVTT